MELKGEACGVLRKTNEKLPPLAGNRARILNDLSILGKCTDPNAIEFNFTDVCAKITRGIQSNSPKWRHPILNPFYVTLYDELKCAQREMGENPKAQLNELIAALETTEGIKKYRLLDPEARINTLCREAQAFAGNEHNLRAIKTLRSFLVEKSATLPPESKIRQMVEATRAGYQKKFGKVPSNEELAARLESQLGSLAVAAKVPGICFLPIEGIIKRYDPNLTPEELTEKRRLALPLVREIIDVLRKEPESPKTQEVMNALMQIARSMSSAK
jgi:hypothetical protein